MLTKINITITFVCSLILFIGCHNSEEGSLILSELTISEIHTAFEKGDYSSESLVLAYLNRIKLLNDSINAISVFNQEALVEARKLDREYQETGKLRPLHGIPIIVNLWIVQF